MSCCAGHVKTPAAAPLPPDPPQASAVSSSSFRLSWSPPDERGAPITDYSVSVQSATASASASPQLGEMSNGHVLKNGHADPLHSLDKGADGRVPYSNGNMPSQPQPQVVHVKGNKTSTTISGRPIPPLLTVDYSHMLRELLIYVPQ